MRSRRILFITGTRADFGKLKPLMLGLQTETEFEVRVFITGMHLLQKYGATWDEVHKAGLNHLYKFVNQRLNDSMDQVLAKTIGGLSDYIRELKPDMIVVHGDRVEALAGAIVGAFNNIHVAHIEGGEVSGTIDESIRHAISKMAHLHFVGNHQAQKRLMQLGERQQSIHVIGSPDVDIMCSSDLPSLRDVKSRYAVKFDRYAILLFHPVTTEINTFRTQVKTLVDVLIEIQHQFIVIYPNNDSGSEIIFEEYERLRENERFVIFPSMRFEYFLGSLKNARYIIGNSSAGIHEAPYFGVPTVNLGSRQHRRLSAPSITNAQINHPDILSAIRSAENSPRKPLQNFGNGKSSEKFKSALKCEEVWDTPIQKEFIDLKD